MAASRRTLFASLALGTLLLLLLLTSNPQLTTSSQERCSVTQSADAPLASPLDDAAGAPFNWRAYQFYNPELLSNLTTEQEATEHWEKEGRAAGRCARAVPVVFRYPNRAGLANQLYIHVTALAFAEYTAPHGFANVEVTVPPAVRRGGFVSADVNDWGTAPIESLLDFDHMRAYWAERGIRLSQTDRLGACDLVHVPKIPPSWQPFPRVAASMATMMRDTVCRSMNTRFYREEKGCLVLDFQETLFLINGTSALPYINAAARGMAFSPQLEATAQTIIEELEKQGGGDDQGHASYNGVHLRIEEDWIAAGREGDLEAFISKMAAANFSRRSACYVASGIFSYWAQEDIDALESRLVEQGLCASMQYKERILPGHVVEGFHSEQLALIDLIVLSRASSVVASIFSTFSWYIRELRAASGLAPSSFYAVGSPHPLALPRKLGGLVFSAAQPLPLV